MATGRTAISRRAAAPLLALLITVGAGLLDPRPALAAPPGNEPAPASAKIRPQPDDSYRRPMTGGAHRWPAPPERSTGTGRYVVRLADPPVAAYAGGVTGVPATRPEAGARFAPHSAAARAYRDHLASTRAAVLAKVGARADQTYTTAFNGFSAKLTAKQVASLRQDSRVAGVTESQTISAEPTLRPSPRAAAGARADLRYTGDVPVDGKAPANTRAATRTAAPGAAPNMAAAAPGTGAGVVIGVIDSGIWPESPSFARSMAAPPGWHGTCQTGAQFPASACNGKVLGARYFATAWLANHGSLPEGEVLSPRDVRGHGTHVASTAAGLPVQNVMIDNRNFGAVSGVAPDAHIAVYKALWGGLGENDDIIAAIDTAVADGVHVLNLSAGNTFGDWEPNSPIGNAFLNAHLAGVAVTTSAGNDGLSGVVSNTYPWVTTVSAAVTVANEATVRLGDGSRIVGTSLDALPDTSTKPLVYGFGASFDGDPTCDPGTLDPAKVQGKIVACDFIDSRAAVTEVKSKGGAGVVLFQRFGNARLNIIYGFPTVYLWSREQAGRLSTYIQRRQTGGTAALSTGGDGSSLPGLPTLANFSSYGPDQVHPGVQKPDVMAPGTDVIAAVAPPGNGGRSYDVYSGTSMAAPQVAGAAAILKGLHPTWSPGAIGSALRTTATNTVGSTTPHKQGSGFVDVARANNPGLVVEASRDELTAFSQAASPDGRELNLPAISLRDYDGTRPVTVNRRFRNLGTASETYRATVSGLTGMRVTVSPSSFTVAPGATVSVTITLNRGTALFDRYATGAITWASSAHSVRVPVAARAWGFNPRSYDDESIQLGWTGQNTRGYPRPGFTGPATPRTTGYTPVPWANTSLQASYSTTLFDRNGDNVRAFPITVPSGAAGLLVQIEAPADNNLDLYLFKDGRQVEFSNADWHSNERIVQFQPGAGSYTAYVHAQRATTTTVNFRFGATVVPRNAQYNNADVRLLDFLENPVSTVTRGTNYTAEVTPRGTLPDVEHWSFVELNTNGLLVPGPLVSTR